jgi:hypothetical protein
VDRSSAYRAQTPVSVSNPFRGGGLLTSPAPSNRDRVGGRLPPVIGVEADRPSKTCKRRRRKMPGRSLKATPSGNDRKPADLNSEEAAVRSRNVAATQNFLDRLRDAGHDPDEVFASSVGGGRSTPSRKVR